MSRILFVTDSLQLPSDASQLTLLAQGLAARGVEVHVAAVCDAAAYNTAGQATGFDNAQVHRLNIGSPQQPKRSLRHRVQLSAAIKQLLTSTQPDIVHHWNAHARGELTHALRGRENTTLVETISYAAMPRSYIRQAIRNRLVPHAQAIAIPDDSLRGHLVEAGYPTERMTIIPNAAPNTSLNRNSAKRDLVTHLGLLPSDQLAVTVAPLKPRHRLKDLVWATDLLSVIRDDFHLVIVGAGRQHWRLRRFNSQTKSIGHVHFIDKPSDTLTPETIHAGADVYWNSHLNTPLPSPMLHAMAAGVPAISVLGPGTRELIQHQATGFAVNFGARDEFARWTKYLIEQTSAAEQMSQQCRTFVKEAFPAERMVEMYSAWYAVARKR